MKNSSSLPLVLFVSLGGFFATGPGVRAQGAGSALSLANPNTSLGPTGTSAPNAENPSKSDPNAPTETEILASKGANFDAKTRVAVFEGDVRVNDPRYQMACNTLTVYLAKTGDDNSKDAPAKPDAQAGGGIDHAVAQGRVIIIQRRAPTKAGEEAKVSIGRADQADFDNKTGDMVLSGNPSIEQEGNIHIATAASTTMKLNRVGGLTTVGPSRTVFKSKGNSMDLPGGTPANSPGKPGQGKKNRAGNTPPPGQG